MRHARGLFDRLTSFEALVSAGRRASRGTRAKPEVAGFLLDVEREALALSRGFRAGTWRPSAFRTFVVLDPKPRTICAVPFRDRAVHHALMAEVGPVLDGTLDHDSYACRVGKGVHAAVRRAREHARAGGFFLKLDVRHFFETADHEVVLRHVARKVGDRHALALLATIVRVPVHGSLRGKGLPIGSLVSQHLAGFLLGAVVRLMGRPTLAKILDHECHTSPCGATKSTRGECEVRA